MIDAVWVREDQPPTEVEPPASRPPAVGFPVTNDPLRPSRDALLAEELRDFLTDQVPAYLVPDLFVPLEMLPLNPIGKVERDRRPVPAVSTTSAAGNMTGTEQTIAGIVSEVIGVDQIGPTGDFAALGMHSLEKSLILSPMRATFHVRIRLRRSTGPVL